VRSQFCGEFVQNLLTLARCAQRQSAAIAGQIVALANNFGAFLYKLAVSVRGTC
jgi:Tfp pilus assembly protein PilF